MHSAVDLDLYPTLFVVVSSTEVLFPTRFLGLRCVDDHDLHPNRLLSLYITEDDDQYPTLFVSLCSTEDNLFYYVFCSVFCCGPSFIRTLGECKKFISFKCKVLPPLNKFYDYN